MSSLKALAERFAEIGRDLVTSDDVEKSLSVLTESAVRLVSGAEDAAVSRGRSGRFETIAATSDLPPRVDAIQYELMHGPCVDAAIEDGIFRANDLRTDPRWPDFGPRAAAETGTLSMLAVRLFLEADDTIAGLNLYAGSTDAFTLDDVLTATLVGTHAGLAVSGALQRARAEHLERAVASNRDIGVAMGILMRNFLVTRDQAFDLLRVASQRQHRKLHDVALDVIDTGTLEIPGTSL